MEDLLSSRLNQCIPQTEAEIRLPRLWVPSAKAASGEALGYSYPMIDRIVPEDIPLDADDVLRPVGLFLAADTRLEHSPPGAWKCVIA